MKKELLFIIAVFSMSTVYSQVGINIVEPTAGLDINGSWRFRQSSQVNAIQTISTVLGIYSKNNIEDGHVSPNRINTGLRSTSGMFKIYPKLTGGLSVDTYGLAIKPSKGLFINNSLLTIIPNENKGIQLEGDRLTAKIGNGLQFNTENAISVKPKLDGGLIVDSEGIEANAGIATYTDLKGLNVGYDNGIKLIDNKLVVDEDYIKGQNNSPIGSIGDGLEFTKIPNGYLIDVEKYNGISVDETGIGVKILSNNGIVFNNDGFLNIKPYNGIQINENSLKLKTYTGVEAEGNLLNVIPGKGLLVDLYGLKIKPGNGTSLYGNAIALNTGIATYNEDQERLRLKLSPNSALGLDQSGLKLQIDQAEGLKIENNLLGIAHDESLKINTGSNSIGVNVNTNKGLASDNNGVYVKIGDGLRYNNDGNLERLIDNSGTLTNAINGLSKNNTDDIVSLGGKLTQSKTTIGTNDTNTLALTGLIENTGTNYQPLVIDNNNNIRKVDRITNTDKVTLPTIITLNEDIPNFMINATSYPDDAQNQTIGWDFTINSIPLTMENVTVTKNGTAPGTKLIFPPGTYQVIYNLQFKFTGYLPCKVNSYFAGVPNVTRSSSMSISHIPGESGKTINFGGTTNYTFRTTRNLDYLLSFGLTQNISNDCDFSRNGAPTLKKNGTQIVIYKLAN